MVRPQNPEFEVSEFDGRNLPLADKSVDCTLADRFFWTFDHVFSPLVMEQNFGEASWDGRNTLQKTG